MPVLPEPAKGLWRAHRHDHAKRDRIADRQPPKIRQRRPARPRAQAINDGISRDKTACNQCKHRRLAVAQTVGAPRQCKADNANADDEDGEKLDTFQAHPQYRDRHKGHDQRGRTAGDRVDLGQITRTVGIKQKKLIAQMQQNARRKIGQRIGPHRRGDQNRRDRKGRMPEHHGGQ